MVMFPAHLQHRVEENKSDEDRISISFNISIGLEYTLNPHIRNDLSTES